VTGISHSHRLGLSAAIAAGALIFATGTADAQPRGGHRGAPATRVVVAGPYYYGYGFYDPFWGPWSPYWGYGPWDRPMAYDPNVSSARLQVKPKTAEVYVDGYLAGTVDEFDGALQRLNVPAGEHTLTFYLEGYQTVTQKVLFRPRATINIKYEMPRLAAGQDSGPRPEPEAPEENPVERPMPRAPRGPAGPPAREARDQRGEFGTLAMRVQPRGAVVIVDGQEWTADESGPLTIELADGVHEIEVRQEGFTPFHRTVRIRAGNTTTLNVSLSR